MPSSSSESRPLLLGSEGRYESASEGSEPSLSDAASSELAAAMASDITGATCAPQRQVGRSENGADGFGSMSGCHAVAAHTTRSDAEALGAGATRACAALFGVVSQWPLAQASPTVYRASLRLRFADYGNFQATSPNAMTARQRRTKRPLIVLTPDDGAELSGVQLENARSISRVEGSVRQTDVDALR